MPLHLEITAIRPAVASLALCALLAACNNGQDAKPAQAGPSAASATSASARDPVFAEAPLLSIPPKRDGHLYAEARTTDNKPCRVVLDTGATVNILDSQGPLAATPMTKEIEATLLRQGVLRSPTDDGGIHVDTLGGQTQLKMGLTPALRIEDRTIPAGTLALRSDMARLSKVAGTDIQGVIGNQTRIASSST